MRVVKKKHYDISKHILCPKCGSHLEYGFHDIHVDVKNSINPCYIICPVCYEDIFLSKVDIPKSVMDSYGDGSPKGVPKGVPNGASSKNISQNDTHDSSHGKSISFSLEEVRNGTFEKFINEREKRRGEILKSKIEEREQEEIEEEMDSDLWLQYTTDAWDKSDEEFGRYSEGENTSKKMGKKPKSISKHGKFVEKAFKKISYYISHGQESRAKKYIRKIFLQGEENERGKNKKFCKKEEFLLI